MIEFPPQSHPRCRGAVLSWVTLRATLGSDSQFSGRLRIKLPSDWQIFSLLKSANARPGSDTGDVIDLPAVVSFVPQNLLHLLDIVSIPSRRHFFAHIGSRSERRRGGSQDPCRHQYEDNPRPRRFAG